MNSADFFAFYLHLANQKTLNNNTREENLILPSFYVKESVNLRYTSNKNGPCIASCASDLQPGDKKTNVSLCNTGKVGLSSSKKAFTLLAFAGLCQTITLSEWGGANYFWQRLSTKPCAQSTLSEHSGKIKEFSGKYLRKAKIEEGPLFEPDHKEANYKISVKLKTLSSFKSHNNSQRKKVTFPAKKAKLLQTLFSNDREASNESQCAPNQLFLDRSRVVKPFNTGIVKLANSCNPTATKPLSGSGVERVHTALFFKGQPGVVANQQLSLNSRKSNHLTKFVPRSAKCISFLSDFNRRVLSQSFKDNYIYHLQKKAPIRNSEPICHSMPSMKQMLHKSKATNLRAPYFAGGPVVIKEAGGSELCEQNGKGFFAAFNKLKAKEKQLFGHRKDHQLALTTSAPILNFMRDFLSSSKATVGGPNPATVDSSQYQEQDSDSWGLISLKGSKVGQTKVLTEFVRRRVTERSTFFLSAGLLRGGLPNTLGVYEKGLAAAIKKQGFFKHSKKQSFLMASTPVLKKKAPAHTLAVAKEGADKKRSFLRAREAYFNKFSVCNPTIKVNNPLDRQSKITALVNGVNTCTGVYPAMVDLSTYSYNSALTKFYTASWLLESIRGELSLRNANIRRVLNLTFLATQQTLSSFIEQEVRDNNRGSRRRTPTDEIDEAFKNKGSTVIPCLIRGLRVTISGCMGGKKNMSKTLTKTAGRVTSSTLKEKVDFAKGTVQTKTGSLGVKVWVCYN